jgi:hypothetical protein
MLVPYAVELKKRYSSPIIHIRRKKGDNVPEYLLF